jgi:hypothetical protein
MSVVASGAPIASARRVRRRGLSIAAAAGLVLSVLTHGATAGPPTGGSETAQESADSVKPGILGGLVDPAKELDDFDVRELADRLATKRDQAVVLGREIERLEAMASELNETVAGRGQRDQLVNRLSPAVAEIDAALRSASRPGDTPPPEGGPARPAPARDQVRDHRDCEPPEGLLAAGDWARELVDQTATLQSTIGLASTELYGNDRVMPFAYNGADEYIRIYLSSDIDRMEGVGAACEEARSRLRSRLKRSTDDVAGRLKALEEKVAAVQQGVAKRLEEKRSALRAVVLDTERVTAELRERGSASTSAIAKLPWLVGLLALFSLAIMVMVRRFRDPIQKEWIASGQVIQFMTVTVLVTVVLILGLAGTINSEALGTLLGGVAGYVLSQRAEFRRTSRDPNGEGAKGDETQGGKTQGGKGA